MGCRYACICGGLCSNSCCEPERYCGEAEDLYDELHGKSREREEYYKAMEEEYYSDMAKDILADENSNALEKEQAKNFLIKMGVYKDGSKIPKFEEGGK